MVDFISHFIKKHYHFGQLFNLEGQATEATQNARKERRLPVRRVLLRFLKVVPYVCILLFGASFFWDFGPEQYLGLFGFRFSLQNLLRTVAISGLIGYGTNWVAIRMLFRPRERRPIWGQGLIPANKNKIAQKLAGTIHSNILNEEEIKRRIHDAGMVARLNETLIQGTSSLLADPEFQAEVKKLLYRWLHEFLNDPQNRAKILEELDRKIHASIPKGVSGTVVKSYLNFNRNKYRQSLDNAIRNLPDTAKRVLDEYGDFSTAVQENLIENADQLEQAIAHMIHDLVDRISIKELLRSQLERFDESQMERMIWGATNEHLQYIQYLGGLLGMLGGLVLWQPELMLAVIGTLGGILVLADRALMNAKRKRTQPPPVR
mgnify:CR=1 FL=1